ncbi:CIA30 family protein [Balneolaceae bacterium YR4-1]|uniref:CIA30 family protein n=2 Tax=Halalkalibaculum roseum TaxID=2709311 RepID=A0A6M1SS55_9BACT|nr:CIA30 family protein [Halalkalibaculum roseum]
MNTETIFNFEKNNDLSDWKIVNDNVMGGRSDGTFYRGSQGNGIFEGSISLKNNGGFASVRYWPGKLSVEDYDKIVFRLKGDGKRYQFRIKNDLNDYRSYITYFETSGEWQEIEISLQSLYPSYRGRTLDQPNFSGDNLEELGFLFGNGREEDFRLEIKSLELQ